MLLPSQTQQGDNMDDHSLQPAPQIDQVLISQALEAVYNRLLAPVAELETLKRKELLTELEVSKLFNVPVSTLKTQRCRGFGPPYIKDGARVSYPYKSTCRYYESRLVKTNERQR